MAFTAEELKTWVEGLGLDEASKKAVLESMGKPEVLSKVGETVLMRSEFSKKMDALQSEKTKFEKEYKDRLAKEDEFHDSTAKWKTAKEKEAQEAIEAAREEAEAKLAEVQKRIRELAKKNGIDEEEIKDLVSVSDDNGNKGKTVVRDADTGRFLTKEDFEKRARSEGLAYAKLIAKINTADRTYRQLFGADAPEPDYDKIIDIAAKTGKSVTQVFEEEYKVGDKRKERDENQRKADLDAAEKRGAESARSKLLSEHPELSSRTVTREREGSPILAQARAHAKDEKRAKDVGTGPHETVNKAVEAFRSGKYKDGVEHAA